MRRRHSSSRPTADSRQREMAQQPQLEDPPVEPQLKKMRRFCGPTVTFAEGVRPWNLVKPSVPSLLPPEHPPKLKLKGGKRSHGMMTQEVGMWNSVLQNMPGLAKLPGLVRLPSFARLNGLLEEPLVPPPSPEHPPEKDEPKLKGKKRTHIMMTQGIEMLNFALQNVGLARPSGLWKDPPKPQPPRPSNPTPPEHIRTAPLPIRPIPRWPEGSS